MSSDAGPPALPPRPAPPPLPARVPDSRQRMLHVLLIVAIVVLVLVSIVFALVVWRIGFLNRTGIRTTPAPGRVFMPPPAADALVLRIQSGLYDVLRGGRLAITGSGNVTSRDGCLVVGDASSLQVQDAITVSAWFRATAYDQPMTIAGRAQNGPPWQYPFLSWLIRINTESIVEIGVGHRQSYSPSGWNVPPLQPDQWYFVAMTYDGRVKNLFLNQSHITSLASGSPNGQSGIRYTPGRSILIGADESEAPVGDRFQGAIDDVRIYDRALTADEVQRLFQEGARRLPMRR